MPQPGSATAAAGPADLDCAANDPVGPGSRTANDPAGAGSRAIYVGLLLPGRWDRRRGIDALNSRTPE